MLFLIFILVMVSNSSLAMYTHFYKLLIEAKSYQQREIIDTTPNNRDYFDFIVIGAGSAGATLASRLTENKNVSVLVVEAGGHENLLMNVPGFALYLQYNDGFSWDYEMDSSNKHCLGFKKNRCNVGAIGKVKGGSSSVNFMIATRGNLTVSFSLICKYCKN